MGMVSGPVDPPMGVTGGCGLAGGVIGVGGRHTGRDLNLRWWYTRDDQPVIFRHGLVFQPA